MMVITQAIKHMRCSFTPCCRYWKHSYKRPCINPNPKYSNMRPYINLNPKYSDMRLCINPNPKYSDMRPYINPNPKYSDMRPYINPNPNPNPYLNRGPCGGALAISHTRHDKAASRPHLATTQCC